MKTNKGFTLIELLVVIAIIGILSSVVLASLTTARSKGQEAAIKSQLSNMRAQAELFYSNHSNAYSSLTGGMTALSATWAAGVHTDTTGDAVLVGSSSDALGTLLAGVVSSKSDSAPKYWVETDAWAVAALVSGTTGFWCVDSKGNSIATTAYPTSAACN